MPVKRLAKRLAIRRRQQHLKASGSVEEVLAPDAGGWLGWIDRRSGFWGAAQFGALVVAGAWGVFLLMQSATERRIDNALRYATQLSEGRTGEARHLLDRLWYSQPENVSKIRGQVSILPKDMQEGPIQAFVADWIAPGNDTIGPVDVQLAIADIADTLDQVAVCATECEGVLCWRGAQCHEETTRDLFCGYADNFHLLYGAELRKNKSLMEQMTRQFYGQAQAAINEIARRMSRWQISPDFVFAMLTKESREEDDRPLAEQFVPIASFALAQQTKSTVLTSSVIYPETIGYLDALGACNFVLGYPTEGEAFFSYGLNSRDFQNLDVITETTSEPYFEEGKLEYGPLRTNGQRFPSLEERQGGVIRLVPGVDPEAFFFTTPTRGLGKAECSVFQFDDGRWYVKTFNQNVHFPENEGEYLGNKILDFESPVPISLHIAVGPQMTWKETSALRFADLNYLAGQYPDEIRGITEASFDCAGNLDAAAEVICEEPALAAADGQMAALYKWASKSDPDRVREAQRQWVSVRDRACRPGRIDRSVPTLRRSLVQCLLEFTASRSRDLILKN